MSEGLSSGATVDSLELLSIRDCFGLRDERDGDNVEWAQPYCVGPRDLLLDKLRHKGQKHAGRHGCPDDTGNVGPHGVHQHKVVRILPLHFLLAHSR